MFEHLHFTRCSWGVGWVWVGGMGGGGVHPKNVKCRANCVIVFLVERWPFLLHFVFQFILSNLNFKQFYLFSINRFKTQLYFCRNNSCFFPIKQKYL